MAATLANKIKFLLATKKIDFSTDEFRIILMAEGFVFNRVSHQGYADVSEYELPTGNGYLQNTKVLTGVVVTENDTDNRTEISWNNASWAASGGSIGPVVGAIILDSTITTPVANAIVGYVDFGEAQTQADGGIATIANIEFWLS